MPLGPEIQYEYDIAGKRVTFKKKITVKEAPAFFSVCAEATSGDPQKMVPVLCFLVEEWDFEGDPSKAESYDDLDVVGEFLLLAQAANKFISQRMAAVNSKKA